MPNLVYGRSGKDKGPGERSLQMPQIAPNMNDPASKRDSNKFASAAAADRKDSKFDVQIECASHSLRTTNRP